MMAVSTSTASRLPEISVEEIGDHFIPLVPGAKSLVTAGIWALTKTTHCNRLVMASPIQGPSRIEASTSSNGREDVSRNRSTSILLIIRLPLLFGGNKIAENLGPSFLEVSVPLQSALQHCLYSVLGFGPSQRCPKRSEGIEEPVGRRQRNLVDEILRGGEGSSIEGGDPAREGVDEAVQFGVGKRSVDITVSFRAIAIEVVGAENDFERPAAANQMGQALCASTARMQTDTKLGMAESRVLARREAHVAGEDELAADAAGAAPDFCDADNRRLREPHERIHENRKPGSSDTWGDVPNLASQIKVGQVEGRNRALEDNDTQILAGVHPNKQILEGLEDVRVNNVEGWVVEYYPPVRRRFLDHPHVRRRISISHRF